MQFVKQRKNVERVKFSVEEEPKIAALGAGMDISNHQETWLSMFSGGTADIAVLSLEYCYISIN